MKKRKFFMRSLIYSLTMLFSLSVVAKNKSYDFKYTKSDRVASQNTSRGFNSSILSEGFEKPKWEFKTAPIAFLARWLTLDASYRLSDNWATGPAVILYNSEPIGSMFWPSYKGYAVGWSGNYYFSSVYKSTWYVSSHGYYESYDSYPHAYSGYKEIEGLKLNTALGYQWKGTRLNVLTGVGVEYINYNINGVGQTDIDSIDVKEKKSYGRPFIEFKVGLEI